MNHTHPLRVRFAPSPTGYLHLGAVRTILFNIFLARSTGGSWALRLEDTDRNRLKPDAFIEFMDTLEILGLTPDEGITFENLGNKDDFYSLSQKGEYGPYIQSNRLEKYHTMAGHMLDKGIAYWSHLSPEDRQDAQAMKQLTKKPINWFEKSKKHENTMFKPVKEVLSNPEMYPHACLRFKLQRNDSVIIDDLLLGALTFDLNLEEDPVFLKKDGYPTYALAHLVDDQEMNTDIAIRTQEWTASLPAHRQSYIDVYGKEQVKLQYLHAPFILGETGNKKMSKRDGNVNMKQYIIDGFLPEALVNYLAFLGWNPGTEKELYF